VTDGKLDARLAAAAEQLPHRAPAPATRVAVADPTGFAWCTKPVAVDAWGAVSEECCLPAWHEASCPCRSDPYGDVRESDLDGVMFDHPCGTTT